jgi:carotenoid 1,2-hydratase
VSAPDFDRAVPPGGYAWWYLDALDADGRFGLAIIGFIGSVFSPYYAHARRRGPADPLNHCSINVGLYLPQGHYWTMTERPRASVARTAAELVIGPSALQWDGTRLRIDIDEITVPFPHRIRGTVLVHPRVAFDRDFALDPEGAHRWRPVLPCADVEVNFESPALRWRGTGYVDSNVGNGPLEDAFTQWQWTRTHLRGDATAIAYDAQPRVGAARSLNLRIERGAVFESDVPRPRSELPRTRWGIARSVAVDPGTAPRIVKGLEGGPFYARSLLAATMQGEPVLAVHESLSLDRFAKPWVQAMLPFRMPRTWATPPRNRPPATI